MGKSKHCWLISILLILSLSCFVTHGFALDPKTPTPLRVGVIVPSGVLLFDGQDYTIPKIDTGWIAKIQSAGWTYGKACNGISGISYPPSAGTCSGGGQGFFYTVTSTPGISRPIPGNGKALAVEGWGQTMGQTDFYLQYGNESDPVGKVPGDVWFQFWLLAETDPSWKVTEGAKFIYPSKRDYPSDAAEHDWLALYNPSSYLPRQVSPGDGTPFLGVVQYDWESYGSGGACFPPYDAWKLGQVDTTNGPKPGEWYLVRLHMNTSEAAIAAGRHLWEMYSRKYGTSGFTLISRWQNGQDYAPGTGGGCTLTWNPDHTLGYGHKMIRIPTVMGKTDGSGGNMRYYLKDFAISRGTDSGGNGVNDLPYYPDY